MMIAVDNHPPEYDYDGLWYMWLELVYCACLFLYQESACRQLYAGRISQPSECWKIMSVSISNTTSTLMAILPRFHWEKREWMPSPSEWNCGQRIKISWPFTLPLKVYLCVTQYWLQAFKEIILNSIHHSMGVNVSKQNGVKHHSTALWDCGKTLNIDCSFTSNSKKGPSLEISWWLADLLTMVLIIFKALCWLKKK